MITHPFRSFGSKLFLCCLGLFAANLSFGLPVKFNIPAQPASAALQAFAKQAGVEVLFPFDELSKLQSKEVAGEMEPADALKRLLGGTGYDGTRTAAKNFVVKKAETPVTTGAVKGTLTGEGGKGLPNVLVTIRETALSTETDKFGQYVFPKVAAGTYVLVASAPGYQTMHITDVQVRAGRDLLLGKEEMRRAREGVLALDPFVVHADAVEELEKFEVTGTKQKPFEGANVDIPRTINDAQPYYVFEAADLERSGTDTLDDFLKQRLTMNTTGLTNLQNSFASSPGANALGGTSTINLRGLGADKTLVLVNGRRLPSVMSTLTEFQSDINGIPMASVERIEVLPTSASGIYGGSALGGVVNIILKRNYTGGEVRARYENTADTDAPVRSLSVSLGVGLGKKTNLSISGQFSDAEPLLIQDRIDILRDNVATITRNNPAFFGASTGTPQLGSLPNITSTAVTTNLVLKSGVSLGSNATFIAAGTAPGGPITSLYPSLIANAGKSDANNPPTRQYPYGLIRPFGSKPERKAFTATVRHQLFEALDLFADFRYTDNAALGVFDPVSSLTVPAASPANPFNATVRVRVPLNIARWAVDSRSISRSVTFGFNAKLPYQWIAEGDYTYSRSNISYSFSDVNTAARDAALLSGALNPFVDTLQFGLDLDQYLYSAFFTGQQDLESFALRPTGPLPALPWGTPQLVLGFEQRKTTSPWNRSTFQPNVITEYFPRRQVVQSAYGELTVPLVKARRFPLLQSLEAQVAGRLESFTVRTGTPNRSWNVNTPTVINYPQPLRNGLPFSENTKYDSNNLTVALKYQPIKDVMIRVSRGTAFLPPTAGQLVLNTNVNQTSISRDPRDPTITGPTVVQQVSGGNPDLKPQDSKSFNVGVVWQPAEGIFKNLRANVEYYAIEQHNAIGTLTAATLLDNESLFPDRVTRDAAGHVTLLNLRNLNLFARDSEGVDCTLDYFIKTSAGRFSFRGSYTRILKLKTQFLLTSPAYEGAGYPNDGDGAIEWKTNATVGWERGPWYLGWTTYYTPSYWQVGAPGGSLSLRQANGGVLVTAALTAQGSLRVADQMYHDLTAEYSFVKGRSEPTGWRRRLFNNTSLQVGIKNVFDTVPPFDASQPGNFYLSAYGDARLRSYWVNLKRSF